VKLQADHRFCDDFIESRQGGRDVSRDVPIGRAGRFDAESCPVLIDGAGTRTKAGPLHEVERGLDLNPRTSFFGQHKWKYKEAPTNWAQLQRAGNPQCLAPWASCEDDRHYAGYYIGGGATFGGDARVCRREGTWGWDYAPWWSKVRLGWFHGRRYQAGEGQYQPDKERVSNPLNDFTNP
jgi:hypothetical protein